jgi:hypothetical protein
LNYRKPLIHIGMPKTATKTLQWRLFSRHSEVYYLGRFDGPQFEESRRFGCCRDKVVQQLMHQIAHGPIFDPDFDHCAQLIKSVYEEAGRANLVPVWSWESYSTDALSRRQVRARNLRRVFGEANIVMVLRNPNALLESAYFQHMKRENVSEIRSYRRPPYYRTMDEWLRDNFYGEILPHLQYGETVQAYVRYFGRDNVHVLLFEDLVENEKSFFEGICRLMQINVEEGLRLVSGERDNERWTMHQIEILKGVLTSSLRSFLFRFRGRAERLRLLGLDDYGIPVKRGAKAIAPISPEWQTEILKVTREGNRWLEEQFGLPLTRHGYPGVDQ